MILVNAETFAKNKGVNARTVADWFAKKYLPHATQDAVTKTYSIPDDTPRPYKGNASVKRISSLIPKLLDAADLQQSVFPAMFPKIDSGTVIRTIENLEENGFIRIQTTPTGDRFLELTQEGMVFKESPPSIQKKIVSSLEKGLSCGKEVISVVASLASFL